jgi:hypothetical protein
VGGVFVSYRNGEPEAVGAIRGELVKRFGRDNVFRSLDSARAGDRYPAMLLSALEGADVLVAVIGPGWLAADESGMRLIERAGDWVRMEIAMALRAGVPIVPVLLTGATPLAQNDLPADIQRLADTQALVVRDQGLDVDLRGLVWRIEQLAPMLGISRLFVPDPPPLQPLECAPSTLLRPEYGIVEFTGRDHELDLLRAWTARSELRSVKYLVGPAGAGKTRLAMALCAELAECGWAAGFLAEDAPAVDVVQAGRLDVPLLIAVEDVGAHLDRLAALANAVASCGRPVRVLLLSRREGGWLRTLRDHHDPLVAELFQPVTVSNRIELSAGPADAGEQFARAARAIARVLNRAEPAGRRLDPTASMLDVHAAALDSVLGGAAVNTADAEGLRPVVAADRRQFRSAARGTDLATVHLATVATVATLCRPASGPEVTLLHNELPLFLGAEGHRADEYAEMFANLYPGRFWLDAVRPAPVGDAVMAATLGVRPNIIATLAAIGNDEQLSNALAVLGSCVLRHPETGQAIVDLVRTDPDRMGLLGTGALVRIDEPDGLARWLGTGLCDERLTVNGFLAILDRLRDRVTAATVDEFVRGYAREMATVREAEHPRGRFTRPAGSRAGQVESAVAQFVHDLLEGRAGAEHVHNVGDRMWVLLDRMLGDQTRSTTRSVGALLTGVRRRRQRER